MNKTILKHEFRSMKWTMLISILASLFLTFVFSRNLDFEYGMIFKDGLYGSQALIQNELRQISSSILTIFTGLSIIQVYMQFKSEKDQEIGRFLKSLPVKNQEFFKVKLITGIANLSLAFIVLILGFLYVRASNMFWIKDIYSISAFPEQYIAADGVMSLIGDVGLIYLVILSFYTFLFMIQYTFSSIVGGIFTGILVWLSPIFIVNSLVWLVERFVYEASLSLSILSVLARVSQFSEWLLPSLYPFGYDYSSFVLDGNEMLGVHTSPIDYLGIKYLVSLALILINIIIAYNLNKRSRIEDENKVIAFKSARKIFKFGVTICSALLVSTVLNDSLAIQASNIILLILMTLAGAVGYFISRKITEIGLR